METGTITYEPNRDTDREKEIIKRNQPEILEFKCTITKMKTTSGFQQQISAGRRKNQ